MAFYSIEPFGYDAEMLGHGITASMVYNVNRKKGAKALEPSELIPRPKQKAEPSEFFRTLKRFFKKR